MKVWIGNYRYNWSTHQMDRLWYRWRYDKSGWEISRKDRDRWDRAYERFAELSRLLVCRPVNWIKNKIPRIHFIHIDDYDTWSADSTLAPIILPMLKILKEKKHGAPYTNDEDVPEYLRSTAAKPKENEWDVDEFHFARWDWIMGEMIWAFEQITKDDEGEDQFRHGYADIMMQAYDANHNPIGEPYYIGEKSPDVDGNENVSYYQAVEGPAHSRITDYTGLEKHHKRIQNGLRLFGTYYRGLWD